MDVELGEASARSGEEAQTPPAAPGRTQRGRRAGAICPRLPRLRLLAPVAAAAGLHRWAAAKIAPLRVSLMSR
jgi:hypothetical protein